MNAKLKTTLIVLLILIVPAGLIYGGYQLYKRSKNNDPAAGNDDAATNGDNSQPASSGSSTKINEAFPLVYNASVSTTLVKDLQERLNTRLTGLLEPVVPYVNGQAVKNLKVDGYYGEKTAAVVKYLFPDTDGRKVTKDMYDQI